MPPCGSGFCRLIQGFKFSEKAKASSGDMNSSLFMNKWALFTIIAPRAAILSALVGFAAIKTLLIPLCFLNGPYQFRFFHFSRLDVVLPGNFPDLVEFHDVVPSIFESILFIIIYITQLDGNSRGDLNIQRTGNSLQIGQGMADRHVLPSLSPICNLSGSNNVENVIKFTHVS
jgi:hypothetical protein